MKRIPQEWMLAAAEQAERILERHSIRLSLGGEPTFVPKNPEGAEWNHSAVGPRKLEFARKFARCLVENDLPGGTAFLSPGKQYPGEPNPRWALRILYPLSGSHDYPSDRAVQTSGQFRKRVTQRLRVRLDWQFFAEPTDRRRGAWAALLDHDGDRWVGTLWPEGLRNQSLLDAEGPSGLRLPLDLLPSGVSKRALTFEMHGDETDVFFPPLLAAPFLELLGVCRSLLDSEKRRVNFLGYLPPGSMDGWEVVSLASDPGVLEINLPPCRTWEEFAEWLECLEVCAGRAGMRSWRNDRGVHPCGTGGGNHLLFGAPMGENNGFFANPSWVADMVAFWQAHPGLSYLFTGSYVGASSQAPRADESGISMGELRLALADLRNTSKPPDPKTLAEALRHLLVDSSGNPHRAEISLDKFFDPKHPAGLFGLIEFRAIESLPHASWSAGVALLWLAVLARLKDRKSRVDLRDFSANLHDRFFLPTVLWADFLEVLAECRESEILLDPEFFRKIWDWKFPVLLRFSEGDAELEVRQAHETWPLLAEVPPDGGLTSRFVDSSLRRLEFRCNDAFQRSFALVLVGRKLPLKKFLPDCWLAGLRYRHSNLYPSLHPRLGIQLPLRLEIRSKAQEEAGAKFVLQRDRKRFVRARFQERRESSPVKPLFPGAFTRDLRI